MSRCSAKFLEPAASQMLASLAMKTFAMLVIAAILSCSPESNAHLNSDGPTPNVVDGPGLFGDSGVQYPTYESIQADLTLLAQQYPNQAEVLSYGKTIDGRDLTMLRMETKSESARRTESRPAVQISGAIHGNEFLGIEDKLPRYFLENQGQLPGLTTFLASGGVIYFIPVINPDGFVKRQRGNSKRVDLNRDFDVVPTGEKKLNSQETQALARYLASDLATHQLRLAFALDYHCCVPALITPWTYQDAHPTQSDLARYGLFADIQRQTIGFKVGNASETVGYLAHGTSTDYFYGKYGTTAFTIEGKHGGEMSRIQHHVDFFDRVFDELTR